MVEDPGEQRFRGLLVSDRDFLRGSRARRQRQGAPENGRDPHRSESLGRARKVAAVFGYGVPPVAFGGLDWIVFGLYVGAAIAIGLWAVRFAAKDSDSFFLAGRRLPWWLLGTSMVATTFSTDTPNLVAELVRQNGVAANWAWWAFCITGMLTVFVFAPLWRRSRLTTDLGFYEIRYGGRPAAFLRGFRAVYLGVFFNCVVIATVTLAGAKIGGVLFGLEKSTAVLLAGGLAAAYAVVAGFWGVVVTDLLQFVVSMVGAVVAAVWALDHPAVGGLSGLVEQFGDRLAIVPPTGTEAFAVLFIVPVALQWWSVWYPGAEPGGGGYIAQRMLAARSEGDALRGTLWFNIAHYTLRPWPWILVALASLAVYPDLAALQNALPGLDPALVGDDLAYPLMLRLLPPGLLGLAAASLAGAYMSTVDTHLNWGASYLVEDVYRRFFRPAAGSSESVAVARIATVLLMAAAGLLTLFIDTARGGFGLLLQIGAGTGPLFIARWLWWRINAWSEIAAMAGSLAVAVSLPLLGIEPGSIRGLVIGLAATTVIWLGATLLTPAESRETLDGFVERTRPPPAGWGASYARTRLRPEPAGRAFLAWPVACVMVYSVLFGAGAVLFGRGPAVTLTWVLLAVVSGVAVSRLMAARE